MPSLQSHPEHKENLSTLDVLGGEIPITLRKEEPTMGRVIEYAVVIVVLVAGCSMLLPQQSPQAQMSDANYWNGNPGADTAGAGLRLVAATGEALTAAADLFFNGTAALNTVSTSSPASRVCMGAVLFAVIPFGVLSWVTLGVWRRIFRRYL